MTPKAQSIKKTRPSASARRKASSVRTVTRFFGGNATDAYEYFGAHLAKDKKSCVFRVYAPNADRVSVCGDFNSWDPRVTPMQRISETGIWEAIVEGGIPSHCKYKYFVRGIEKNAFKSDPFGVCAEKNFNAASAIEPVEEYSWRDGGWLAYRKGRFTREAMEEQPIHVYRMDPLFWKRHGDGAPYSCRELASDLIPYVKQMGYTHVELLGVTGGSSHDGKAVDALFAPSPCFGEPWELMALIDSMHEAGIGVILSWSPFAFAASEHGLSEFDGTFLYEYETEQGSVRHFDLGKAEVQSLLLSSALFWTKQYHADGLSVKPSVVAKISEGGKKNPRGREIAFLRKLHTRMATEAPDVMIITEKTAGIRISMMGSEIGDTWEEGRERELSWQLLDERENAEKQLFTAKANHKSLSLPTGGKTNRNQ